MQYLVTLWKYLPPLAPFGLVGYGILLGTRPNVRKHNYAVKTNPILENYFESFRMLDKLILII